MTQRIKQRNYKGDNIGRDYVGGDKVNALIGKIVGSHNVTNIHVVTSSKFKLSEEDEKKFSSFIPEDKISEFRNLIERIEFSYELYDLNSALSFIEEANKIYHNHPMLLVLSGLCEYSVLDKIEVIKYPEQLIKSVKLFEKAREVHGELGVYRGWNTGVAHHFYEILQANIEQIKEHKTWYDTTNQYIQYYKVIAKHLIHLENCFRISASTQYLKEFVNHLAGYEGYAWFNISENGDVTDLGISIFDGGAEGMITYLSNLISKHEEGYIIPEIKYGSYFETPGKKSEIKDSKRRLRVFSITIISSVILLVSLFLVFSKMSWTTKILVFLYPLLIWGLSHQFGGKLSVFQRIAKLVENVIR